MTLNTIFKLIRNNYFLLLILLTLILSNSIESKAQQSSEYGIEAMAYAYKDSIALRWAPNDPLAWELCNKYGYFIQRITLTKNGKIQDDREVVNFFQSPLKPKAVIDWEQYVDNNDLMAVAAQSIYGETFELTDDFSSDIMQVINKSKENVQRYSFALFAADMSKKVAEWSALSYSDKEVDKDEGYLYKIYSAVPEHIMKIDTGYAFIKLQDYKPLPTLRNLEASAEEHTVMLKWDKNNTDNIYVAFKLERAYKEPENFIAVTELPIINTMQNNNTINTKAFKRDSLQDNLNPYYYRVRGLTPFGDLGPPSDTIMVNAIRPIKSLASIATYTIDMVANKVNLEWEFDTTEENLLNGFNILRSGKPNSGYEKINSSVISPSIRTYTDSSPGTVNYYKVEMEGLNGDHKTSQAFMVQLEDSIPPVVPEELKASIDSTGRVTLTWEMNKETDLLGYKVYRSNFKNSEFTEITNRPIASNFHQDQLSINNLSGKIYYKIVAIDLRYNPSGFSLPIEVQKPDSIPPVAPQIKHIKSTKSGIQITWARSSSADVITHLIYRNQINDNEWQLIKSIPDSTQTFWDNSTVQGNKYQYRIVAKDKNGLESKAGKSITVVSNIVSEITNSFEVNATPNIGQRSVRFTFEFKIEEPIKLLMYRGSGSEPLSLYQKFDGDISFLEDKGLVRNTKYTYRIQAIYKNEIASEFSDEITITL